MTSEDRAAPRTEALDAERLRDAVAGVDSLGFAHSERFDSLGYAEALAAEYQRLSPPPVATVAKDPLVGVEEDGYHDHSGDGCRTCAVAAGNHDWREAAAPGAAAQDRIEELDRAIRVVWESGHSDLRCGLTTDPPEATLASAIAAELGWSPR